MPKGLEIPNIRVDIFTFQDPLKLYDVGLCWAAMFPLARPA